MKAFDRVSHDALINIMEHARWPKVFRNFVAEVYRANTARVIVNGAKSDKFPVDSGTRQGCPLSPLLFTIVAEVFNQNIIRNPEFEGIKIGTVRKKIGAYADDTAVFIGCLRDMEIFLSTFAKYEKATGMALNKDKCEAVLLGR